LAGVLRSIFTRIPTEEGIVGGNILPNHLFIVEEKDPTAMVVKRNNLVDVNEDISFEGKKINKKYTDRVMALRNRVNLGTNIEKRNSRYRRKNCSATGADLYRQNLSLPRSCVLARLRKAKMQKQQQRTAKKEANGNKQKPSPKTKRTESIRTAATVATHLVKQYQQHYYSSNSNKCSCCNNNTTHRF
jgi:hypothetical protein